MFACFFFFLEHKWLERGTMIIVTNNPKIRETFIKHELIWVEGSYRDVLVSVRDKVHQNYKLLTHPLSGSVKPNETPYKTIALESGTALDVDSLMMIENALERHDLLQADKATPNWVDRVLDDFMVIDHDLFSNAILGRL